MRRMMIQKITEIPPFSPDEHPWVTDPWVHLVHTF